MGGLNFFTIFTIILKFNRYISMEIKLYKSEGLSLKVVSLRELYESLDLNLSHFARWVKRNLLKNVYFSEGLDYCVLDKHLGDVDRRYIDYGVTIETAKHLAMKSESPVAHEYRQHLIKCEQHVNNISKFITLPTALSEIVRLYECIEESEPKISFYDALQEVGETYTMQDVSNVLQHKGLGRNNLYKFLRHLKVLDKRNKPYRKFIEKNYFKMKADKSLHVTIDGLNYIHKLVKKELGDSRISSNKVVTCSGILRNLRTAFSGLKFSVEGHKYIADGIQRMSVTKFINSEFVNPVNWSIIAKRCAGKNKYVGMSSKEVQKAWDDKRDLAAFEGTAVHNILEMYIEKNKVSIDEIYADNENINTKILGGLEYIDSVRSSIVTAELGMYVEGCNLAGTADLIRLNEKGGLIIEDWKTNENLFKESRSYFKKPFDSMYSSTFNKYQLQLSIYKYLLETATGYHVDELAILELRNDGTCVRHVCKDFSNIIKNYLNAEITTSGEQGVIPGSSERIVEEGVRSTSCSRIPVFSIKSEPENL